MRLMSHVPLRRRAMHGMLATSVPHLRRPLSMMRHRLNRLAVIRLDPIARCGRAISEIISHAITREHLRRHQSRTNISAVIAQHKAVEAGFPRRPIFLWRNEDRPARSSRRSAKDKRMDALAAEHLHVRHLPRLLFHDNRGERASGKSSYQEQTGQEFGMHKDLVERTGAF